MVAVVVAVGIYLAVALVFAFAIGTACKDEEPSEVFPGALLASLAWPFVVAFLLGVDRKGPDKPTGAA